MTPRTRLFFLILFLSVLFLVSGFAALIYQIVWQRVLFTAFGVNIESITIVVAVFMFGLGVGALVGGKLSQRWPNRLPQLFLVSELAIGVFGLVSLPLIKAVSEWTLHGSLFVIAITIYALLCIPTIFMGATLPILAAYLHQKNKNVGKTVSTLYLVNTAGSAIACFVTADWLFGLLGLAGTSYVAAGCNVLVGLCVYGFIGMLESAPADSTQDEGGRMTDENCEHPDSSFILPRSSFVMVLALAAAVGYLALSQEILWFRAISYVTQDKPTDFAHVLGCVLFGIAAGAGAARWLCQQNPESTLRFVGILLAASALLFGVSLPTFAGALTSIQPDDADGMSPTALGVGYSIVSVSALLLGAVFPLLCHYAVRGGGVGQSISWIYFANIVGSTAGPLLTGFILLDVATLQTNLVVLTLLTAALAVIVLLISGGPVPTRAVVLVLLGLGVVLIIVNHEAWYAHLLEKLHYKHHFRSDYAYKDVIQNRSGIIAIESDPKYGDSIYGGGAYDGRFNLDPVSDGNGISRAYLLMALHPKADDILIVGMSGGAWLRALTLHPDIKKITVVEINPGYVEVMKKYPEIARALNDPRVTLHIDDGRRWLNRHPNEHFDIMIMNSIYHWRGHATNLLSADFLRLCQGRLKPGGFVYYNSTGSDDVFFTAAQVFKMVGAKNNMVIGSDTRLPSTREERRARLLKFQVDGVPLFGRKIALREVEAKIGEDRADYLARLPKVVDALADFDPGDLGEQYRNRHDLWLITDNNMATEYRRHTKPAP